MQDETIVSDGELKMENLLTVGQVASALSCPIWQVQYLLRARDIEPACRVGGLRLFETDIVDFLRRELRAIKKRKESKKCTHNN